MNTCVALPSSSSIESIPSIFNYSLVPPTVRWIMEMFLIKNRKRVGYLLNRPFERAVLLFIYDQYEYVRQMLKYFYRESPMLMFI
jgi:hypothetical protein